MRWTAIALAVLLALAACSSREPRRKPAHDGPRVGGRLVIGVGIEPRDFDQATQMAMVEGFVSSLLGSGLVTLGLDGTMVPVLARSWEQAPDGRRLTFHLRDGVRYASGRRLVASDFKATFDRVLAPATGSPLRDMLAGVTAVRAPDDATLVFELDRPNFNLLLALGDLQPIEPRALARWGKDYGRHPSSVGPYRMKEIRTGESVVLERNPDYRWGPEFVHRGPWYFREIEFRALPEPAAQVAALESREVTMLMLVPAASRARLQGRADVELLETPALSCRFIDINHEDPALADVRVRRAIQHALDREAIIRAAWEGHGTAGYGAVHPLVRGAFGASEFPPLARPYDPAAARRLLDEAGWRNVGGDNVRQRSGSRLELSLIAFALTDTPPEVTAEVVQGQLRDVGIAVRIEVLDTHTAFERVGSGDYDLALDNLWMAPDAGLPLALLLSSSQIGGSGFNFSRYRNPEVDELLRRGRETTSEREHLDALADVQRIFARDAVWATIGYPTAAIAVRRTVRGARLHPKLPQLILDDAWLAEGE